MAFERAFRGKCMKNKIKATRVKSCEKGLTLIEILISLAIIGIIAVGFIPLFAMSAKTTHESKVVLDATYLGRDAAEFVYYLSKNIPYEDVNIHMAGAGYDYDAAGGIYSKEFEDKKYMTLKLSDRGGLISLVVKVYKGSDMKRLQAQFETLYTWVGRGILSEE